MSDGQLTFDVGDVADSVAPPAAEAPHRRTAADRKAALVLLAAAVEQADNGVPRSRALLLLAEAVELALIAAIADAYEARPSWRKLSADLGIPFQTLHRRYADAVKRR